LKQGVTIHFQRAISGELAQYKMPAPLRCENGQDYFRTPFAFRSEPAFGFTRVSIESSGLRNGAMAIRAEDLHRSLNVVAGRLNDILCHRERRHVSEQLTMSYARKQIILDRNDVSEGLGGKYVDLYDFPDGRNVRLPSQGKVAYANQSGINFFVMCLSNTRISRRNN
jgi:hypothetical protein